MNGFTRFALAALAFVSLAVPATAMAGKVKIKNCTDARIDVSVYNKSDRDQLAGSGGTIKKDKKARYKCDTKKCRVVIRKASGGSASEFSRVKGEVRVEGSSGSYRIESGHTCE